MPDPDEHLSFTLAHVAGVTPDKWVRRWHERAPRVPLSLTRVAAADAADTVREGSADAALLRLPTECTGLHTIPLYTETTVVVAPKDHLVTAAEEVSGDDLTDDVVLHPRDDVLDWDGPPGLPAVDRPATTADAVELVAAGVGLLVVPQSLARLHHRKDLTYRPLTDAPQSRVALAWPEDGTTELMDLFIGIVRGRTVNSTRGRTRAPAPATRTGSGQNGDTAAIRKTASRKATPRKPGGGKKRHRGSGGPRGGRGGSRRRS